MSAPVLVKAKSTRRRTSHTLVARPLRNGVFAFVLGKVEVVRLLLTSGNTQFHAGKILITNHCHLNQFSECPKVIQYTMLFSGIPNSGFSFLVASAWW